MEAWALLQPWPKREGVGIPPESKGLRLRVLTTLLEHGRPMAVADEFRELIEGDGKKGTLTSSSHLANLLGLVANFLDEELKKLKLYSASVIFDGASDHGERVVVLIRGVKVGTCMEIVQKLIALVHMDKSYTAAHLNSIISTAINRIGFKPEDLRFFVHDDVSVNKKSTRALIEHFYTLGFDISCFAHIGERVGEFTDAPVVQPILSPN
jgi:hypothetical protein